MVSERTSGATAPASQTRRRYPLLRVALLVALLFILCLLFLAWLVGTESGAKAAIRFVSSSTAGAVTAEGIQGRLAGRLHVETLTWDTPDRQITAKDLLVQWRPVGLLRGRLHVQNFHIGMLGFTSKMQKKDEPLRLPDSLALPLKVQIDEFELVQGSFSWGPLQLFTLDGFAGSMDFDGSRYRLELDRIAASSDAEHNPFAAHASGAITLEANKPFALNSAFSSSGQTTVREHAVSAAGTLSFTGTLSAIRAAIDASVRHEPTEPGQKPPAPAIAKGEAVLRPFSERPLGNADLSLLNVDLAILDADLPRTDLNIAVTADESGAGKLSLRNAAAGLFNEAALPVFDLQILFQQQEGQFIFPRIDARLGSASRLAGQLGGKGKFAAGALTLALQTEALDLKKLDSRLRTTRLAGNANIQHANGTQELKVALTETLQKNLLSLAMHAKVADARVSIDKAELQAGLGKLIASGELELEGKQAFTMQGNLNRFRPEELGNFPQLPPLLLNGHFFIQGSRTPTLRAQGEFRIENSQIADQALQGNGRFQLNDENLRIPDLVLMAGANRFSVQGELSQQASQLAFSINAPKLEQFGPGFAGRLVASGTVRGNLSRPRIVAEWNAEQVSLPGLVQIQATQGKAQLGARRGAAFAIDSLVLDANARGLRNGAQQVANLSAQLQFSAQAGERLHADIRAQGLSAPQIRVEQLQISAQGTTSRHDIDIQVNETTQAWHAGATGGLRTRANALSWQGNVSRFDASGRFAARLQTPAPLALSKKEIRVDDFRLSADGGVLVLNRFVRTARKLTTDGRFEAIPLASLLKLASPDLPVSTDMQLDGEWDVALGEKLAGALKIRRRQGDIVVRSGTPLELGIGRLELTANASNQLLAMEVVAEGRQLGIIQANANMGIVNASGKPEISPSARISGNVRMNLPNIGWLGPLASPGILTEGTLQSNLTIGGSLNNPSLDGQLNGSGLRVQASELGVDLRQGVLDASFTQTQMIVRQLRFQSANNGYLLVSGPIGISEAKPEAQLRLEMQRFALLERSDRQLTLSGTSNINLAKGLNEISGDFLVDSGYFDIGRQDAPRLSEDVIIVGKEKKESGASMATLDVRVRLGKGIALIGRGLDALLQGELRFMSAGSTPLQAQGTLRVAKGTFTAYGRELAIEQGALRFNGPINNPSLDILAMRRGEEVEAGVMVLGTVLAPRVTLVSEPTVPEAERLSWLVLGRGLSSAGESDLGVLQSAAGALLAQRAASGAQSKIASAFSLDELGVATSDDSLQQRIVTLGKKVSSRLQVSYQRGLETASHAILLRYVISTRLTLEAETGTRSVLSLFYNFSFD